MSDRHWKRGFEYAGVAALSVLTLLTVAGIPIYGAFFSDFPAPLRVLCGMLALVALAAAAFIGGLWYHDFSTAPAVVSGRSE